MTIRIQLYIDMKLEDDADRYLHACARIRNVSVRRLLARLVKQLCNDQLIPAVLDDDGHQPTRAAGEEHTTHYYPNARYDKTKTTVAT